MTRLLLTAALVATLGLPARAEMGPEMTCLDFTMLKVDDSLRGQQDATKMLKEAAAAAGTLPARLAETNSVVSLAAAIASRCETQPDLPAMEAMLEGS